MAVDITVTCTIEDRSDMLGKGPYTLCMKQVCKYIQLTYCVQLQHSFFQGLNFTSMGKENISQPAQHRM